MKKWMMGLMISLVAVSAWASPVSPSEKWQVYDSIMKETSVTTNSKGVFVVKTVSSKAVVVLNASNGVSTNAAMIGLGNKEYSQEIAGVTKSPDIVTNRLYKGNTNYYGSGKQILTMNVTATNGDYDAVLIGTDTWSQICHRTAFALFPRKAVS